jgi:hypothetical protein
VSDGWGLFWMIVFFFVGVPLIGAAIHDDDRPSDGINPPEYHMDSCWDGSGAC